MQTYVGMISDADSEFRFLLMSVTLHKIPQGNLRLSLRQNDSVPPGPPEESLHPVNALNANCTRLNGWSDSVGRILFGENDSASNGRFGKPRILAEGVRWRLQLAFR